MKNIFSYKLTQYSLIGLLFISTAFVIIPSQLDIMQYFREFATHIMLAFLMLGMAFFILDQKQLMISSLISCAILCVFLKDASHQALFYPRSSNAEIFRIIHINAASAERRYEDVLDMIEKHEPDFITVQECTPDWFYFFGKALTGFPYQHKIELPISFGSVLYSKHAISPLDTLTVNQIPNLVSQVQFDDGNLLTIVNTYLHTPEIVKDSLGVNERLDQFSEYITARPEEALLHIGDFNLTYWSGSILEYRLKANLNNSRKGIDLSKMNVPYDHVFYTDYLECVNFSNVLLEDKSHIGIVGDYLFKETGDIKNETYSSKLRRF